MKVHSAVVLSVFALAFLTVPVVAQTEVDVESTVAVVPVGGTVFDPDSNPVEGARVYLLQTSGGAMTLPVYPEEVVSGEDGRYLFEAVSEGNYMIWAEAGDWTSLERKLRGRQFRITSESTEGTNSLDLQMHVGCGYDVSVKDEDGEPIANARIWFGWTDLEREYRTDEDGLVQVRGLAADDWYFIVGGPGKGTQFKKTARQELGSVEELEFVLPAGGDMRILVQDNFGEPISGAKLWVSAADISMSPNYAVPVTDEDGYCRVRGLPVGRPIQIYSSIEGFETTFLTGKVTEPGEVIELNYVATRMPYGGDVVFTIKDEYGDFVEGATVENNGRSSTQRRVANTDDDGVARLNNLFWSNAGFEVTVHARTMVPQKFTVEPGTQEEPAEVEITMVRGGTLRGKVLDPDGQPVAGMRVYYNNAENAESLGGSVRTDEAGRFQVQGLPEESTLTLYTPAEFEPIDDMEVRVPQNDITVIEIDLYPEAIIRARAIDAETGEPIPEFNVRVDFCDAEEVGDVSRGSIASSLINPGTNVHGTMKEFRLGHLVERRVFKLIVSADGYETTIVDRAVAVTAGEDELLDVALEKEE
ncbi:MAG: carboxypeptidase-like regulatory domain-containing protein [Planctomycetota bacterium]